jgi:transcriptional regulator with XRE-family HTH domain
MDIKNDINDNLNIMTATEAVRDRIKKLLKERKMTLYRLTLNAGLHQGTISKIMSASNKSTSLYLLIQIADGFEMTVSEFLDDDLFDSSNFNF